MRERERQGMYAELWNGKPFGKQAFGRCIWKWENNFMIVRLGSKWNWLRIMSHWGRLGVFGYKVLNLRVLLTESWFIYMKDA
jgi:hypothetical protein